MASIKYGVCYYTTSGFADVNLGTNRGRHCSHRRTNGIICREVHGLVGPTPITGNISGLSEGHLKYVVPV